MRGNNKKLLLVVMLILVVMTSIFFVPFHKPELKELPKVKVKEEVKKKTFAIMLEDNYQDGNYTEYESEEFPTDGYTFNSEKSKCTDTNDNIVKDVLSYDYENKLIKLDTSKTVYCYIYYDRTMFFGSGTEQNPFKINHIEDLVRLSNSVNNGDSYSGKYFELTKDLDFKNKDSYENSERTDFGDINGVSQTETLINELTNTEGTGFEPIGTTTIAFQGNIDGKNNRIDNLYINIKSTTKGHRNAFIGYLANGSVKNLIIQGKVKTSVEISISGIVNRIEKSSMDNCVSEIEVTSETGRFSIGGIAGWSTGDTIITNCTNKGNITNGGHSAGIIGGNQGGTLIVENCHNYGKIENNLGYATAGLIGESVSAGTKKTIIKNSSNNGEILINNQNDVTQYIGGLIGGSYYDLEITNSFNQGKITHSRTAYDNFIQINIGGLVGLLLNNNDNFIQSKIINSYNIGNITGGTYTGGIIGTNRGNIKSILNNVYNSGIIDNTNLTFTATSRAPVTTGGIISLSLGKDGNHLSQLFIINSYNKGNVNGYEITGGIVGYSHTFASNTIINTFNAGNLKNVTRLAIGGLGDFLKASSSTFNKLYLNNTYNLGTISSSGSNVYGLAGVMDNFEYFINNSYYNKETPKGTGISNDSEVTTGMNENDMKNQTFVDTLNNNLASIDLKTIDSNLEGYNLNRWTLGTEGYPVFEE